MCLTISCEFKNQSGGLMKCLSILSSLILILTSCSSMYEDCKGRAAVKENRMRDYKPVDSIFFGKEDKNIRVTYNPDIVDSGVSFSFKKKGDKAIKIIWDETVYMSPSGASEGVHHSGVTLADRANSKPPTVIPPKATHNDDIVINSLVNFNGQCFEYLPICGKRSLFDHTLDDIKCINQIFGFYITYELDGKRNALTIKYQYIGSKPKKK
jgi:hypothetical protein